MCLGIGAGLAADAIGLKRTMTAGLLLLAAGSALGAFAQSAGALMVLRAVEGLGFLLASMPAPGLIRRLVSSDRVSAALGMWGAYVPVGTAIALLCGPPVIHVVAWRGLWLLLALVALAMAIVLGVSLPPDPVRRSNPAGSRPWSGRLMETLGSKGPWLVALAFAVYSAQWLAVIGFLPTIYAQAGITASWAGAATALAALVNMIGNVAAGRLLQRGAAAPHLLAAGYLAMIAGGIAAFALDGVLRYTGVLMFSMVGGLIPGTLFSLAVRLAPGESTLSTTVGWMQQWSAIGQFAGPPVVAAVASTAGGWQWSGAVTACFAAVGLLLSRFVARALRERAGTI
jgi:MFS family permease